MGLEDRTADVIFTNPLARSDSAEQAVFDYSHLDTRDLNTAIVKCTPATSGGKSWHLGGTNPNAVEHLTVMYQDSNGKHVTTKHINRSGNAC